ADRCARSTPGGVEVCLCGRGTRRAFVAEGGFSRAAKATGAFVWRPARAFAVGGRAFAARRDLRAAGRGMRVPPGAACARPGAACARPGAVGARRRTNDAATVTWRCA